MLNGNEHENFHGLLSQLALHSNSHSRTTDWYREMAESVQQGLIPSISQAMKERQPFVFAEVGTIFFPWLSFGSINSSHLFGLDEIILFSYYYKNRDRYSSFLDLGANVGLHSLVTSKLGMRVTAVEPDPTHLAHFSEIMSGNSLDSVEVIAGAATAKRGLVTFVRVQGNSTGSHILGAKSNPYGDLLEIEVEGYPVLELVENRDLVKMDVEGLEADLLESLVPAKWSSLDVLAEIGSEANAARIFKMAESVGLNLFAQKNNWNKASTIAELPHHHSEGSVFISSSDLMDWS